jgi:peptidoglycan/xylan/chitin deacetylase (PgdA/CDA1 family)
MTRPTVPAAYGENRVNNGHVALTFDDGPHPDSTPALLAALGAARAKATFFLWGEHVRSHPHYVRALRTAGMRLGNHSFTHPHLTRVEPDALISEIAQTQIAVRAACQETPTLFRPPYGDTDARVRATAEGFGLTQVMWSVDTGDWAGATTRQIVRAAAAVQPGGIILLHDRGYQSTVEAVPLILRVLADRGLRAGRIVPAAQGGVSVVAP